MKSILKSKKTKNLITEICKEHHEMCKVKDRSMAYLWYMYTKGTKNGDFQPFMFLAEIKLLIYFNYLESEQKDNLINMMISNDEDNLYMVALIILELRKQRIKEKGIFTPENINYKDLSYVPHVINFDEMGKALKSRYTFKEDGY